MTENGTDHAAGMTRPVEPTERTLQSLVDRHAQLLFDRRAQLLTTAEYLELLAVEESIRRWVSYGRALGMREALTSGATWQQVADAVGTDVETARSAFARWIDGQERLYDRPGSTIGLSPDDRRAVRALLDVAS